MTLRISIQNNTLSENIRSNQCHEPNEMEKLRNEMEKLRNEIENRLRVALPMRYQQLLLKLKTLRNTQNALGRLIPILLTASTHKHYTEMKLDEGSKINDNINDPKTVIEKNKKNEVDNNERK
ncbi:hypothetical protein L1987_24160 [Smallanthus sonchifolius]|uniref:Uncharacterized protein n=1 Tax=Smallanthus sonchifolius TaxID=185202 RepID=A0ACB9IMB0_9ASTR|nr:hypothetical protein L1987_24160 [Smallanthus sonchifolius]